MRKIKNPALLALVIGAGLFLVSRRATAAPVVDTLTDLPVGEDWSGWYGGGSGDPYNPGDDAMPDDVTTPPIVETPAAARLGAFLYMIQCAEVGVLATNEGYSYATYYGGSRFYTFDDHPVITGEKAPQPLPAELCRKAEFGPGCVTTAAGAYQITRTTWDEFRQAGAWGDRLPDFSPESQDEAARRILYRIGALPLVERGDFDGALRLASKRWASLPGSTAGQNPQSYARVRSYYDDALPMGFA